LRLITGHGSERFIFSQNLGGAYKKEVIYMQLVPWRPFGGELSSFRREMDSLWNRFFGETPLPRTLEEEWLPNVEISETKDDFIIKAELPGVDEKDVNVSISENILTIKGEKKKEEEVKDEHYYSCERCYGAFQRSFQLPTSVQGEKVEAAFDKGVLRVTLPKVEEAKKKEITIKLKQPK
jgi:HSP20 family protein